MSLIIKCHLRHAFVSVKPSISVPFDRISSTYTIGKIMLEVPEQIHGDYSEIAKTNTNNYSGKLLKVGTRPLLNP